MASQIGGGMAVIRIGAAMEPEMNEKKDRVDDALHATRETVEEDIFVGDSVALLRASSVIDKLNIPCPDGKIDAQIDKRAIEAPLRQLCENAGIEGGLILQEVLKMDGTQGYNVATAKFEDLIAAGVVDPTIVNRTTLQNAASVAGLLLTTECIIAELPDEKSSACRHMPNHGMDDMM
jgi:chaperonin GroEL